MFASPPAVGPGPNGAVSLSYRDVLRMEGVGRLLSSAFFARLGGEAFSLAIVLYVYAVFGSARLAGLAVFAAVAPGLIVSPLAGALLDRVGPVRGIAVDLVASAVLVTALALAARPGAVGAVVLMSLAALFSLTSPLSLAGARTLTPRLVPPEALERVNALDASSYSVVGVLGPALAGALFAAFGGRVTLLTLAGLYAAAFALLAGLTGPSAQGRAPAVGQTLARSAAEGLKYVLKHPVLRALVVCYGLYQVAFGVLTVTVTYVAGGTGQAAREHGVRVGLLWALVGVAGVVGALLVGRGSRPGRERRAIVAGILVTSVACAAMALGFAVALVLGLVAVGLAAGPVDVGLLTLRQRRTDRDWLGRVLAVSISLNVLGFPVGSALGGFVLSGTRSPALAFLTAAAAAALGTAAAGLMLPRRTATAA